MEARSTHSDRLSSPLLSAAYEAGIDVDGARIESHDGYTMVSEDGSWIIGPSGNPKQSSISSNRSSFDAGICTGKFHTVMVIKNRLEWGAQKSCVSTASPNDFYRHSLHIELRQQDEGQFLFKKGQRLYPAKWPVLSCYLCSGTNPCRNSHKARYDVVAYPMVHSAHFGPVITSLSGTKSCRVEA